MDMGHLMLKKGLLNRLYIYIIPQNQPPEFGPLCYMSELLDALPLPEALLLSSYPLLFPASPAKKCWRVSGRIWARSRGRGRKH